VFFLIIVVWFSSVSRFFYRLACEHFPHYHFLFIPRMFFLCFFFVLFISLVVVFYTFSMNVFFKKHSSFYIYILFYLFMKREDTMRG
jgi:hypothetical protein